MPNLESKIKNYVTLNTLLSLHFNNKITGRILQKSRAARLYNPISYTYTVYGVLVSHVTVS